MVQVFFHVCVLFRGVQSVVLARVIHSVVALVARQGDETEYLQPSGSCGIFLDVDEDGGTGWNSAGYTDNDMC
jgi:hypothetical protein